VERFCRTNVHSDSLLEVRIRTMSDRREESDEKIGISKLELRD